MQTKSSYNLPVSGQFVKNLASYVFIALLLGVAVGHYFPEKGIKLDFLGTFFLYLIEPFIQPVIVLTIVIGISSIGSLEKIRSISFKAIAYFIIITTLAILLGVGSALFIEPGKIDQNNIPNLNVPIENTIQLHEGFLGFLILNRPLILLIVAIILGIFLSFSKRREKIVFKLQILSQFLYKILIYLFF